MTLEVQATQVFATVFAFSLKAKNFHWNVEGQNFVEYHGLFDKLAHKTGKMLDCLAESIRTMNVYIAANFEDLKALSLIQDTRNVPTNKEMLSILLNDCRITIGLLDTTYKSMEAANHHGMCHMIGHIIKKFRKFEYLLVSASKP